MGWTIRNFSLAFIMFALAAGPALGRSQGSGTETKKKGDKDGESIDNSIDAPKEKGDPEVLRLHLMDGSMFVGKLSTRVLTISTEFGTLEVPVASIRSFTPGLNSHPEIGNKVAGLIQRLSHDEFKTREEAQKKLVRLGPRFTNELQRYRNDEDPERRLRIRKILAEFGQIREDEEADAEDEDPGGSTLWIRGDRVKTDSFTIVGQIQQNLFDFNSAYGKLNIRLSDIREAEKLDPAGPDTIDKKLTVRGDNKIQTGPKSSGIRVTRGDRVRVTASGTVYMTPWGRNRTVTPDGNGSSYSWYDRTNKIGGGSLVCRIGKSGKVFMIGSRKSFTATHSGMLYFGVAVPKSYISHSFPGDFKLRIRIDPKNK